MMMMQAVKIKSKRLSLPILHTHYLLQQIKIARSQSEWRNIYIRRIASSTFAETRASSESSEFYCKMLRRLGAYRCSLMSMLQSCSGQLSRAVSTMPGQRWTRLGVSGYTTGRFFARTNKQPNELCHVYVSPTAIHRRPELWRSVCSIQVWTTRTLVWIRSDHLSTDEKY